MKHFALIGNPNSGKTTLFNSLTGSNAYVGNWPGVTVDKKEGTYKKEKEPISIVDLPGIYSLSPYTPEEVISRNYILNEKPECIINIVDATNLERNLYLTTQVLEMNVPVVIALNMMDTLRKNKEVIDVKKLSERIGVPVVEISALKEENLDELMHVAYLTSLKERKGTTILTESLIGKLIEETKNQFKEQNIDNSLYHAIKLVELDEIETKEHHDIEEKIKEYKSSFNDDTFGSDFEAIIADARYKYICKYFVETKTKLDSQNEEENGLTKSDKIDKVMTHKWFGIPIFLLILFIIFNLTFSENLFFLGGIFSSNNVPPCFENTAYEGLFWTSEGINSPGVIFANLVTSTTDLISDLISSLLPADTWYTSFIVDGILGGLFAVIGFVPQILVLFLFFSILEDSGYMARIAFILDRILKKFGLSGRAFMPLIMGFGCSVPAMINTRTLLDEKERTATIRVIPFFSCGAKLPILTAIAGAIIHYFGIGNVDLITYGMYLLGMTCALLAVIIMRNTSLKGEPQPFIMELPTYHLPQFKSLMLHLWDKLKHFLKKAFTIIFASTIIIWFLSNFNWTFRMCEMDQSILASIGKFIQPIFTPLGFGVQLQSFGWVFAVAAITGLIAKENVVATLFTLACCIVSSKFNISDEFKDALNIINDESTLEVLSSIIKTIAGGATPNDVETLKILLNENNLDPSIINSIVTAVQNLDYSQSVNIYLNALSIDSSTIEIIINEINTIFANESSSSIINYADIIFNINNSNEDVFATVAIIDFSKITLPALISFIAFNMTTIPCFAACATAKAELPKGKFITTIAFWLIASFTISSIVYTIGSWWWTLFIWIGIASIIFVTIRFFNKKLTR